ncbi:dienelactone hydrolase [Aspergillus sclerotiicarbonarius CBS 121057]|uniref:Dienelactone hydrolase n=1 Tax=Aspergillus sclerotiicarbonarius (strain CBS 121057 / IBT 28362) TaxID=1448318 RepID=A0A319DSB0_ASPSB|nr:dienelactone hydrolase [Aspergillus sclerotiicarbonarius CBS 121057]
MPLPDAKPVKLTPNLTIHAPLSRQGHGPGILIIRSAVDPDQINPAATLDPEPLQKWAEEGYVTVEIEVSDDDHPALLDTLTHAINTLNTHEKCTNKSSYGLIVYSPSLLPNLTQTTNALPAIKAIISYGALLNQHPPTKPHLYHLAEPGPKSTSNNGLIHRYRYPHVKSPSFILPSHTHYSPSAATLAHTRCLEFLKPLINGPWFDLEAIWEEHTKFEFEIRSVEATMETMVQEPYVNHIPTLTGGIGREKLAEFYAKHFIFCNPGDMEMEVVSRTVGIDRVVDEFVLGFTHDRVVDWLIPGIPPTGKRLRIPFMAVVNIRGDRLYHEHITWDQLTVLVQLGLVPEYLPIPYPLPQGPVPRAGGRIEYRVPGGGVETAEKMVDESCVPSNEMLGFAVRECTDLVLDWVS